METRTAGPAGTQRPTLGVLVPEVATVGSGGARQGVAAHHDLVHLQDPLHCTSWRTDKVRGRPRGSAWVSVAASQKGAHAGERQDG
jgi:hypothetical protein